MTLPDFEAEGTVKLGGKIVPGEVTLSLKAPSGLDVQQPSGANGYTTKHKGYPPVEMVLKIRLWEQEDVDDYVKNILPLLRAKAKNGAPDPLSIEAVRTSEYGVTAVSPGDIDDPESDYVDGRRITVNLTQWTPGSKAAKQPAKSPKTATGPNAPKSVDDGLAFLDWAPSSSGAATDNLGV